VEPFESHATDSANSPPAGSVDDVCQRLLLWGQREGGGLARVEYSSEFDWQRVVQRLQNELAQAGVAWSEIELPTRCSAVEVVQFLRERLGEIPAGVVSVTGFATAFEAKTPLEDALRVVNFNREALVALPLRQLWWMTPVLLQTSLHAMPDLHGWFRPQLQLAPTAHTEAASASRQGSEHMGGEPSQGINFEDAQRRSQNLLAQFFTAQEAGASDQDLLTTYLLPALESLEQVGAQQQLRELTSRFEGFLGSLKLDKTTDIATAISRLAGLYLAQGRYSEAEPLYLQALEITKSELGDRHPSTAISLNNLGTLYSDTDRPTEAATLMAEALSIFEEALGPNHPSTSTVLDNLAAIQQQP
jgi:tetratricopeptide (TPR) repeat protein